MQNVSPSPLFKGGGHFARGEFRMADAEWLPRFKKIGLFFGGTARAETVLRTVATRTPADVVGFCPTARRFGAGSG
jgi:hypothetical protein